MSPVNELLSSLYQRGVSILSENGQLHIRAPKGALSSDEFRNISALKSQIIAALEQVIIGDSIQPRAANSSIPLTALQAIVWRGVGSGKKHTRACTVAVKILGELNIPCLERSIAEVVRRHESLRTRILVVGEAPIQCIDRYVEYRLKTVDVSDVHGSAAAARMARLIEEFVKEEIEWEVGPLFGARLFKLSADEHVLVISLDHMITDGISNGILRKEIWTSYIEAVQGLPCSLPAVTVQFPDYAVWQQQTLDAWMGKHGNYWKSRLIGAPRVLLPFDDGLTEAQSPVGKVVDIPFGEALSLRLRHLARREGVLLSIVALTIYVAAMCRWCGQRDLTWIFVDSGRDRPELVNMIGWLVNHLFLRLEVSLSDSLLELLGKVKGVLYAAYDHRDRNRVPLLIPEYAIRPSSFLYFNWMAETDSALTCKDPGQPAPISLQPFTASNSELPPFTLGTFFSDRVSDIAAQVVYRPDRFLPTTIASFVSTMTLTAEEFARCPDTRVLRART